MDSQVKDNTTLDVRNIQLGLAALGIGLLGLVGIAGYREVDALFPKAYSFVLIVLGLAGIIERTIVLSRKHRSIAAVFRAAIGIDWRAFVRMLPALFIVVIYVFLFKRIGVGIMTPILVFSLGYYLGYRKLLILVLVSVLVTLCLYGTFGVLLRVPMPFFPTGY